MTATRLTGPMTNDNLQPEASVNKKIIGLKYSILIISFHNRLHSLNSSYFHLIVLVIKKFFFTFRILKKRKKKKKTTFKTLKLKIHYANMPLQYIAIFNDF